MGIILTSAILVVCGLVLRVGKMVEILAGYKEEEVEDKEGLANWTGNILLIMGVLTLGALLFENWIDNRKQAQILGILYMLVVAYGGVIVMIVGSQKYKKK